MLIFDRHCETNIICDAQIQQVSGGLHVFSQGIVSVPCDELGDQTAHLLELILAHLLVLVSHVSIASPDDHVLNFFVKVGMGP